jgi:hypothetical protein
LLYKKIHFFNELPRGRAHEVSRTLLKKLGKTKTLNGTPQRGGELTLPLIKYYIETLILLHQSSLSNKFNICLLPFFHSQTHINIDNSQHNSNDKILNQINTLRIA